MIDLKGKRLTEKLLALLEPHRFCHVNAVPTSSNDPACQAIIDSYDDLADYKSVKIDAIKLDGLTRIQAVLPGIVDFDTMVLIRELWLSVAPAARQPVATFTQVINIYTAGRNAITSVSAATTEAQVNAVVPAWP